MTWYYCLYAPRTGGAYDSHHRTAGIAGRTRGRDRLAARGARVAVPSAPHLMAEVLAQFAGVLHFLRRAVASITLSSSWVAVYSVW